jgi:hypothetical protein
MKTPSPFTCSACGVFDTPIAKVDEREGYEDTMLICCEHCNKIFEECSEDFDETNCICLVCGNSQLCLNAQKKVWRNTSYVRIKVYENGKSHYKWVKENGTYVLFNV